MAWPARPPPRAPRRTPRRGCDRPRAPASRRREPYAGASHRRRSESHPTPPTGGGCPRPPLASLIRLVETLHDHGHALAAAHAHRLQAERLVPLAQAVEQRAQDAGAGHAKWVTERDRASVRVQLVAEGVDADPVRGLDDLGSGGLVVLHDVDVVDRHLGSLQRLLGSANRTKAQESLL